MNFRMHLWKFYIALCLVLISLSGYVWYYERKIEHLTKWFQDSVKLLERKKPVNNLTYPAFKHPLSPPYPFPYKFLINQPDKCKNRKPFLVIMILGMCHDSESRHTIRETWGNVSIYDVEVVRIFLVGLSKTFPERIQDMLEEENGVFGDIVQQDFMDTYYNLTLKTLMGMEWVTKFCPSASYVIKIDNDMFLNVDNLVHQLLNPDLPVRENYFTGHIVANTGPLRSKAYKWYVPEEVYPNDTYPPYCSGPGYVFSADMAKKIYDVAQEIRVIPMEDAFMGICLYELHIPPTEPPDDQFNGYKINYDRCRFRKVITVHHYVGSELRSVWADFQAKKSLKC
ncbi:beta-1,3-galactosyltransferase 1-like [Phyllobates terribilis]|uniref:beta-1,3-galactosyltransferase 1-like n=1 Tax=Phyllobates terribilis TaxID=111132 RepID=UPI003CCB2F88